MTEPITWEDFFTVDEIETTKRVRRGQQALGPLAREWIAARLGGTIGDGARSRKQFLNTELGQFRISVSSDGDNSTEDAAHARMGVETIRLEDVEQTVAFFDRHDVYGRSEYELLRRYLAARMDTGE